MRRLALWSAVACHRLGVAAACRRGRKQACASPRRRQVAALQILRTRRESGVVLLLIMWVIAVMSMVSLSMALAGRTEIEATRYRTEAEQARAMARGAIEMAMYVFRNQGMVDTSGKRIYEPGQPQIEFRYETGVARVGISSDSGKLNVNAVAPERLRLLLEIAGAGAEQAAAMTEAIVERRRNVRFERVEDLLAVDGVSSEFLYGWLARDTSGRAVWRGGLNRLLSPHGSGGPVHVNAAPYEVLLTVPGMTPEAAAALIAGRRERPYRTPADLPISLPLESAPHISFGGPSDIMTLTATGQADGAAARASIRAVIKREPTGETRLLAWDESAAPEASMAPRNEALE